MSLQKALQLDSKGGKFRVVTRPIPPVPEGHVLVKLRASGLNPIDWKIQMYGYYVTEYPAVLGMDGAGEVQEIGEGVKSVEKGDRVLVPGSWETDYAAYQEYKIVPAEITAKIPSNISFDEAATIPLCLATAGLALYGFKGPKCAGLFPPWLEAGRGKYAGQPILIFGGMSSVGQFAIQLAKLSGLSPIITTASSHNAFYLKSLGAAHVLDRHIPFSDLPVSINAIVKDTKFDVVYDTVSSKDTQEVGWQLLKSGGTLVTVLPPQVGKDGDGEGKNVLQAFGSAYAPELRETAKGLYNALPGLLENGEIKPNRVEVLPGGLAGIVGGLGRLEREEVSGRKLVVRPDETA